MKYNGERCLIFVPYMVMSETVCCLSLVQIRLVQAAKAISEMF